MSKHKYGKPIRAKSHDFSKIPSANIPRSVFDRSSQHKTAFDSAELIPVFIDEALPGDTFHLSTSALVRLSTPIVPIMDNLKLDVHYFSVPYRLVWENWQAFMGERNTPDASTDFLIPQMVMNTPVVTGDTMDYMGVPTGVTGISVSALPHRAYTLIWNEWFRDQNLIETVDVPRGDATTMYETLMHKPFKRCKRHDYFTSCLPWPQKGAGIELPLGVPNIDYVRPMSVHGVDTPLSSSSVQVDASGVMQVFNGSVNPNVDIAFNDLGINLTPSSALTINTLRQAFQIQKMLERDARGGTRYVEIIRSHFGVISPDARVQRPEYLGMSSFDVNVNPVVQNSATTDSTPQGNLAAYGVAGGRQNGFSHSFVEHCIVIGVASVRCDQTYQYGIERMWNRKTRYDFYWPSLAHLGEQAVLMKEIFADGSDTDESVFGYQERYAEYRYKPSRVSGKMRSKDPQSLDVWHLAQKWESHPWLNWDFIYENKTALSRCLAVQDEPQFIGDFAFNLRCVRPMPVYSVPGMMDHF